MHFTSSLVLDLFIIIESLLKKQLSYTLYSMKTPILILSMLLFFCVSAFSQDIILKTNDEMIKCKIKEVGLDEVKFILPDYSQDVLFSIDKDKISKIIFENGEEMTFQQEMTNPANYADNNKNVIKVEFMAPLVGNTSFSWEHSLKAGRSVEATLGIVGLGIHNNDDNPGGVFVKGGYKFIKSPDFYLRGLRYAHLLKGSYVKPEIMMGLVARNESQWHDNYDPYGYYYNSYETNTRESIFAGSVQVVFGKQWVFDNVFAIDSYVGIGYGFTSTSGDDDYYHYGFMVPDNQFPIALSAGLKLGILFK